jgi:phosphatidylglycerophosphate synthase
MFDARLRRLIDAPLQQAGRALAERGVTADGLTVVGCALGLAAAVAIVAGAFGWALALFLAGRLLDGLDGAVARVTGATDRGGYLDITLDFVVYAAIPFAFALHDPAAHALAAAALLAGIIVNGAAFLAFAAVAARRGLTSSAQGRKSIYFLGGLAEGAETIAVYALACLVPAWFPVLAWGFAVLCLVSGAVRIMEAAERLR